MLVQFEGARSIALRSRGDRCSRRLSDVSISDCVDPWSRVEITSDDDVLKATSDGAVALLIEGGFVASLEPFDTLGIGNECFGGLLGVLPVSFGELVTSHAELASLAYRNDVALRINDFGTRMW